MSQSIEATVTLTITAMEAKAFTFTRRTKVCADGTVRKICV